MLESREARSSCRDESRFPQLQPGPRIIWCNISSKAEFDSPLHRHFLLVYGILNLKNLAISCIRNMLNVPNLLDAHPAVG
jgi:hypothetical protein